MEDKLLKFVYTVFLGLIIALFVGMGISTFYPAPTMPEYPPMAQPAIDMPKDAPETSVAQRDYEKKYQQYMTDTQTYHRNVSIISIAVAVMLLVVSFLLEKRNTVITNGVMLGGVFVLVYGIGRGIASTDSKYTFIAVSISLLVVLYLGYRRFSDKTVSAKKTVKSTSKK